MVLTNTIMSLHGIFAPDPSYTRSRHTHENWLERWLYVKKLHQVNNVLRCTPSIYEQYAPIFSTKYIKVISKEYVFSLERLFKCLLDSRVSNVPKGRNLTAIVLFVIAIFLSVRLRYTSDSKWVCHTMREKPLPSPDYISSLAATGNVRVGKLRRQCVNISDKSNKVTCNMSL